MNNTNENTYIIYIDDVFHMFEPEEYRREFGKTFDSYEEAVVVCKKLMDAFIEDYGSDLSTLGSAYRHYGIDPWIFPDSKINHFSSRDYYNSQVNELYKPLATELVKERIIGTRKGSSDLAYNHSIRVAEILQSFNFKPEVCLAGLLHDIVEDGNTTLEELKKIGFSTRVVELVDLCSHDSTIEHGDSRWVKMMARLTETADADTFAIKLADVLDNIRGCHTMKPERASFIYSVKAPLLLSLAKPLLGNTPLWEQLKEEIISKIVNSKKEFGMQIN
ncbi:MAG: HD domain-containing protein [bacterium]